MPGFCDSHTHIASNLLLRGLLEDVRLFEWLSTMWLLKRNFDPETLYWASLNGLVEMAKSGVTTFNEHFDAYAVEPQLEAIREIPLRATLGYGFADRGLYESITDWSWTTLHNFGDLVAQHHNSLNGMLQIGLSPHAIYSCGEEMFRLVREVADAHEVPIHIHLAENPQEMEYVAEHYGTSAVRWLHSIDFLKSDVTAAHCNPARRDRHPVDGRDRDEDRPLSLLQRQARFRCPAAQMRAGARRDRRLGNRRACQPQHARHVPGNEVCRYYPQGAQRGRRIPQDQRGSWRWPPPPAPRP